MIDRGIAYTVHPKFDIQFLQYRRALAWRGMPWNRIVRGEIQKHKKIQRPFNDVFA